jgi:2-C-methyl-D-erythritol 4-phosphate cytidylyltransferase
MIVVAAGKGIRLGQSVPKAFVRLRGQSLLERSIRTLAAVPGVAAIVPVVARDALDRYAGLPLADLGDVVTAPVEGGLERQDSVAAGLAALGPNAGDFDLVGVHDAARCLVSVEDVERVIARAAEAGAAILAAPVRDTIKTVEGDRIVDSPSRAGLWAAQTPQVFRPRWLRDALALGREEGLHGTDDAQLVAHAGHDVFVVEGSERNVKLTHPGDVAVAEAWLDDEAEAGLEDDVEGAAAEGAA